MNGHLSDNEFESLINEGDLSLDAVDFGQADLVNLRRAEIRGGVLAHPLGVPGPAVGKRQHAHRLRDGRHAEMAAAWPSACGHAVAHT